MSNTIDEKVVEMRFDNRHFEENVKTSMSSVEKLKEGLNFTGAGKGLEGINTAARNVNLSGLRDAVETVSLKFSMLQVMAVTALQNITNSAINAGKKFISSLTIDPISMGFKEYETQTNAIQTILANTQARQKTVNKQATEDIKDNTEQAVAAVKSANDSSVDDLRDTHREKIKEFENLADEEADILEEKYEKEKEALDDAIEEETNSLKEAHKEKLALYQEEYMQKLKVVDEERFNKLSAIDKQIDAIEARTKAEEKELKQKRQQERIAELQKSIATAKDSEDRQEAEKRLSDYMDDIERERVKEQRENRINTLEGRKEAIEEEYKLAEELLKEEYTLKKEEEEKLFEENSKSLKDDQEEREKLLRKTYETDRDLLNDKKEAEKEAILDVQEAELRSLKTRNDAALAYIKEQKTAASVPIETEFVEGSTLQDVNRALDELNRYADRTIYNFTEMTRNIGTFTAAGVDLDTSVQAIKGIANLAAVSGSNAQQASSAMYQLSQALSNGSVKLMDWNSVVNAGMSGQVFQDALKETARVNGIAIDEIIAKNGSFRESLQEGWLSDTILTETLAKFTGDLTEEQLKAKGYTEEQIASIIKLGQMANDAATKVKTFTQLQDTLKEAAQSGWTKSWQIILGDFDEAKNLFTEISEVVGKMIGDSADLRNNFLSGGLSSGWKQFLNQGIADEEGLKESILEMTKESNPEIAELVKNGATLESTLASGWLTSDILAKSVENLTSKTRGFTDEQLDELGYTREQITALEEFNTKVQNGSVSLDDFAEKMKTPSGRENLIEALMNSFQGFVNIYRIVKEAFTEIFPPKTAEQLYTFTEKVKEITQAFKEFTASMSSNGVETPMSNIKRTLKGVFAALDIVVQLFKSFVDFISPATSKIGELIEKILSVTAGWGDWLVALDDSIKRGNEFTKTFDKIADFLQPVVDKLKAGKKAIVEWFSSFEKIDTTGFSNFFTISQNKMEAFAKIGDFFSTIWDGIKLVFDKISGVLGPVLGAFWEDLKKAFGGATLDDVLNGILSLLGGGLIVAITKMVNSITKIFKEARGFLDGINDILGGVKDVLKAYQNEINAKALLKIAIAVAILVASLAALTFLDPEKLLNATIVITTLFAELVGATSILDRLGGNKGLKGLGGGVAAMIGMAGAVLILSFALKNVASLDPKLLEGGFNIISGMVMVLVGAMLAISKYSGPIEKSAAGFLAISLAVVILSKVVENFSELDPTKLAVGLGALTAITAELVAFMLFMNKKDMSFKKSAGFLALAKTIQMFANVAIKLGSINPDFLIRGVGAIGVMLGELALFTAYIDTKTSGMEKSAAAMLAAAAAILIMTFAVEKMGNMAPDKLALGLVALGSAMVILVVGLNYMKSTVAGSGALLLAAAALAVLTPSILLLGTMDIKAVGIALLTLAGAFGILGAAGYLLEPVAPTIMMLAGAFALLGVGILAMGAGLLLAGMGLTALAVGITALAASGAVGATAFIASLKIIAEGVLALIPTMAEIIRTGIIAFCDIIVSTAPAWLEAFKVVLMTTIDALAFVIPAIAEGILKFIINILEITIKNLPKIITLVADLIIGIFKALAEKVPAIIVEGVKLLKAVFSGIIEAFSGLDKDSLIQGLVGAGIMAALVLVFSAIVPLVPAALLGVLGVGAVVAELALVLAAIGGLSKIPGLQELIADGGGLLETIGTAIGAFFGGIAGGIMAGISSQFPQIGTDLSKFMTNAKPFIDGASSITKETMEGVKALAEVIVILTASNVMNGLTSWFTGGTSLADFGEELAAFGPHFKTYYDSISNIKGPVVVASANAAKALSEMLENLPKKGGLVGWITGESSLTAFGDALIDFGPKLKKYAESVIGIDAAVVTNSANAGKAVFEMASNLPKNGGLVGWITGENSLEAFGVSLAMFGPKFRAYADSVAGITSDSVSGSTNAAMALSALAKELPNNGGLVSLFTGDNSFANFGENLIDFGESFKAYYDEVSSIKLSQLSAVITETATLVDLAQDMTKVKTSGMTNFGESLRKLGNAGVDDFIKAFEDATSRIKDAANGMLDTFTGVLEDKKNAFIKKFTDLVSAVALAMEGNDPKLKFKAAAKTLLDSFMDATKKEEHAKTRTPESAFLDVIGRVKDAIESRKEDFKKSGVILMNSFVFGANSSELTNPTGGKGTVSLYYAFHNIIINALNKINALGKGTLREKAKEIGVNLVLGFIDGIRLKDVDVSEAAKKMGMTAATAVEEALGEHSPSKVFYKIGAFAGQGFVNAFGDYNSKVYNAGSDMAQTAKNGFTSALSRVSDMVMNGIDTEPTIRPVMDLSNIQNGANQLYRLMSSVGGPSLDGSITLANRTANTIGGSLGTKIQDPSVIAMGLLKSAVKELTENPPKSFENTFNINGSNAKEIADEVSRIIQRQVERREASWA